MQPTNSLISLSGIAVTDATTYTVNLYLGEARTACGRSSMVVTVTMHTFTYLRFWIVLYARSHCQGRWL
ncbi:MAG: hypothetical protein ACNYNY_00760 [Candidatus Oxydemutatoraceae bacterium WSBS_2016_MAG_OTU14]